MSTDVKQTLKLLNKFFEAEKIDYWLEAGTALGAYRDKEIMPWDHDMDVAIWYDSVPIIRSFREFFEPLGFDVIPQKNFPFLDNIIQLKVKEDNHDLMDVDIYLYKEFKDFAYMRWINSPVGLLSGVKQRVLYSLNALIYREDGIWLTLRKILPLTFCFFLFKTYLYFHVQTTYCIFHRFPKSYFKNLKIIEFYGIKVKIAEDTEAYLEYRYGGGWRVKDQTFNQTGKWKKSQARVRLKMSHIPMPAFFDK